MSGLWRRGRSTFRSWGGGGWVLTRRPCPRGGGGLISAGAGWCGFFENEYGAASLMAGAAAVNQKIGRSLDDIAAGWERAKSIMGIVMEHEAGAGVVEHVATRPGFRRRGLVERLVHEMLERGRQRGGMTADIGGLIGHGPARRG